MEKEMKSDDIDSEFAIRMQEKLFEKLRDSLADLKTINEKNMKSRE